MLTPWEVRRNLLYIVLTAAIICIFIGAVALVVIGSSSDEDSSDGIDSSYTEAMDFGLSTTATTVGVGDTKEIDTISYMYDDDDCTWTSSDTSIATVSSDGTVTGVSAGTATITAEYNGESATCEVTVSEDGSSDDLKVYNMNTDTYDYALFDSADSTDGFLTGQLSLSFNMANYAVVSLAGYDSSWLEEDTDGSLIGNYLTDFDKIVITVTANGSTVATATYTSSDSWTPPHNPIFGAEEVTGSTSSSYQRAQAFFDISDYKSGTVFTVTVTLANASSTGPGNSTGYTTEETITGTFTYCTGDGTMDSTGVFTRTYSWRESTGTTSYYSITQEFSYSDYAVYYNQNLADCNTSAVLEDYTYHTNIDLYYNEEFVTVKCQSGDIIEDLVALLKEEYLSSNDLTEISDESDYAQYLLTFVQTCFMYAYEQIQYYNGEDSEYYFTEYWAYPAETFWSGNGDCEDTSILAATIFKEAGFDAGVYLVPGHAIAAIALDDYDTDGLITTSSLDIMGITGTYNSAYYGIMEKTVDGETYYGCETTVEASREIGVISRTMNSSMITPTPLKIGAS